MASLLTLPAEIRMEIYRHLLCATPMLELSYRAAREIRDQDRVHMISPEYTPKLHIGILTACWKIHNEATTVLYRENCFIIRAQRADQLYMNEQELGLPFYNLHSIKDLTVSLHQNQHETLASLLHPIYHSSYLITPSMLTSMLRSLFSHACTLNYLTLDLGFSSLQERSHNASIPRIEPSSPRYGLSNPTPPLSVSNFAEDCSVAVVLHGLPIAEKIDIHFSDQVADTTALFEGFVQRVAAVKGWSWTKTQRPHYVRWNWPDDLQCKWSLSPAEGRAGLDAGRARREQDE